MATAIPLEPATIAALDTAVSTGRFSSRDEAIRIALHAIERSDAANMLPLTKDEVAGIERGLADVAAGRVLSADQVRAELERRHAAGR